MQFFRRIIVLLYIQATNDCVFTQTSPPSGEFNVDLVQESTDKSLGISVYGGADAVTGPSAVYIEKLSPDGIAACDGRLHAGNDSTPLDIFLLSSRAGLGPAYVSTLSNEHVCIVNTE